MDWIMIMKLVMAIISTIMQFLGGGTTSLVMHSDDKPVIHLASYEWSCEAPAWTETPKVTGNDFSGTVSVDCKVAGSAGIGLEGLKDYLKEQNLAGLTHVYSSPYMTFSHGLVHESFEGSVTISADDKEHEIRGESDIGLSETQLVSKFTSISIPQEGSLVYLKGLEDTLQVTATDEEGQYEVRMSYRSRVTKPWFVDGNTFLKSVVEGNEAKMLERRERTLNDVAAHL